MAPFLAVSAFFQMKQTNPGDWFRRLGSLSLGAATTGAFMIPNFLRYGMDGLGGTGGLIRFNPANIGTVLCHSGSALLPGECGGPSVCREEHGTKDGFPAQPDLDSALFYRSIASRAAPADCDAGIRVATGTSSKGLAGHQAFSFFDFPFGVSQLFVCCEEPYFVHVLFDAACVHAVRVLRLQSVVPRIAGSASSREYFYAISCSISGWLSITTKRDRFLQIGIQS